MARRDPHPPPSAAAAIETAAHHLDGAHRHAITLERLAVSILTFGLVAGVLTVALVPPLVWVAAAGALAAAALWGVLRALALQLHLSVDRTMVELEDEPVATEGAPTSG